MIPAAEALRLPSARLTNEETEAADRLEIAIEEHVRKFIERRGCDFDTGETNGNVIAEVNQRLKAAGFLPQWQPLVKKHALNAAQTQHVGFRLSLAPNDEAYQTAARFKLVQEQDSTFSI